MRTSTLPGTLQHASYQHLIRESGVAAAAAACTENDAIDTNSNSKPPKKTCTMSSSSDTAFVVPTRLIKLEYQAPGSTYLAFYIRYAS